MMEKKVNRRDFLKVSAAATAVFSMSPQYGHSRKEEHMNYVRAVDFSAIDRSGPGERFTQVLLDHTSGSKNCTIHCIKTPAGGGSPAGLHTHQVDQIFYILKGKMSIEIEGKQYEVGPGTLVFFPTGVPHRNWNGGSEPTLHLAFNTPMPDPNLPFGTTVKP